MQLADLPHGLIENSGDDPAMGVRRRTNKAPRQTKAADEALALLVENKLQPESGVVGGTATEAIVGELLFLELVTVDSLVPGHVVRMRQSCVAMQVGRAISSQPSALGKTTVPS